MPGVVIDWAGGVTERLEFDDTEKRVILHRQANALPVIEANKHQQSSGGGGWSPSRELRHVARIPLIVALLWQELYGVDVWNRDHWSAVRRLLNDPDWRWLRTSEGKV